MEEKKKNNKKILIIALVALIIILIAVVACLVFAKGSDPASQNASESSSKIGYEANVVVSDRKGLQDTVDEMVKKAEEGNIALEFQNEAFSDDGKNFTCYIANSVKNNYDMFLALYEDSAYSKQMFLTGLIPTGSAIDHFALDETLEKGTYNMVLVLTQVEDDHETLHAQVSVTLTLTVN